MSSAPRSADHSASAISSRSSSSPFALLLKQLQVAEDDRQHVVEVVGDAAGELADELEALRAAQPFLGRLALRDVLLHGDVVGDLAAGVADRRDGRQLPEQLAVLPLVVELAAPDVAAADRLPEVAVLAGLGVSRLQHPRVLAHHLGVRVAGHLGELRVDVLDVALDVGDHHRHRALLDALEQLAQVALRPLVRRDVLEHQQELVLAGPAHGRRPHLGVGDGAVGADDLDVGDLALDDGEAELRALERAPILGEQRLGGLVDVADLVLGIDEDDGDRLHFDDRAPASLAFAQRLLRPLPLAHVLVEADDLA